MGGKKPINADISRGSCRSRRGRHDHHGKATQSSITDHPTYSDKNEFSLFSSFWILDSLGQDEVSKSISYIATATPIPSTTDVIINDVETITADNNDNASDEFKKLSKRLDKIYETLNKLENKYNTKFPTNQEEDTSLFSTHSSFASLNNITTTNNNHNNSNQMTISNNINIDLNKVLERLSTLEGRHSVIQSKLSNLDAAFEGSSSAVWTKGCKTLSQMINQYQSEHTVPHSLPQTKPTTDSIVPTAKVSSQVPSPIPTVSLPSGTHQQTTNAIIPSFKPEQLDDTPTAASTTQDDDLQAATDLSNSQSARRKARRKKAKAHSNSKNLSDTIPTEPFPDNYSPITTTAHHQQQQYSDPSCPSQQHQHSSPASLPHINEQEQGQVYQYTEDPGEDPKQYQYNGDDYNYYNEDDGSVSFSLFYSLYLTNHTFLSLYTCRTDLNT